MALAKTYIEELERLASHFQPSHWSGSREEIENAFGDLQNRLEEEQRQDLKAFVQGCDANELHSRTAPQIQSLTQRINTGRDADQMYAAQEAINQIKRGALSAMQSDERYQESRSQQQAMRANEQAEDMKVLYDKEGELLQANGFTRASTLKFNDLENENERSY